MSRPIPPLNPLRAFEVAARHLSFKRAAEELFVTPSAVSHQVRTLEESLGIPLFVRDGNTLTLTPAGRSYLPSVQDAFALLVEATRKLKEQDLVAIRVNVPPTFALKWLLPRMPRFMAKFPQIDLKVSTSADMPDFGRDEIDLAVRYGSGQFSGMSAELCLPVEVFPVCSPRLLEAGPPLEKPADLAQHTLLHDDSRYANASNPTWADWLRFAGVEGVDATRGPSFWPSHIVLNAAAGGMGVALAKAAWVQDDLKQGMLVKPFDLSLKVPYAYFAVYPSERGEDARVRFFLDWVREELAAAN